MLAVHMGSVSIEFAVSLDFPPTKPSLRLQYKFPIIIKL